MLKATENWLKQVEYDLETAEHMLKTGRFLYVIFMCHISLEKALKAIVSEETKKLPPRTHNLIELMQRANLSASNEHKEFIGKLSDASVVTRYPDDFSDLVSQYPEPVATQYLKHTKEVIAWIRQNPRLRES